MLAIYQPVPYSGEQSCKLLAKLTADQVNIEQALAQLADERKCQVLLAGRALNGKRVPEIWGLTPHQVARLKIEGRITVDPSDANSQWAGEIYRYQKRIVFNAR